LGPSLLAIMRKSLEVLYLAGAIIGNAEALHSKSSHTRSVIEVY
jgi:hypothetical protein